MKRKEIKRYIFLIAILLAYFAGIITGRLLFDLYYLLPLGFYY